MITLARADTTYPLVRILTMPPGNWTATTQPWTIQPIPQRDAVEGSKVYGYELLDISRAALPDIGTARFMFRYGLINDGALQQQAPPAAADLIGQHVRIQMAEEPSTPSGVPAWRTVFLGTVDSQADSPWPSNYDAGNRTYHCTDLLYRTSRWPLCHHHTYDLGVQRLHCFGHPGYNYSVAGYFRRLMGNAAGPSFDPFGDMSSGGLAGYQAHAITGSNGAALWKDSEAVQHALYSSRANGEPIFKLKDNGLLIDSYPWPVGDGEKCWDFIIRVLSRQRGRGIAFLDWDDDVTGDTTSVKPITPYITVKPQNYLDVVVNKPSGGSVTMVGSTDYVSVDLIGDQRFVDDSLQLVTNDGSGVDYLETYGEPIETLVTLGGPDQTIEQRWTNLDETAFLGLANFWQRQSTRWRQVFQRWSIPSGWDFQAGDGNGGAKSTCHYVTKDDGSIAARNASGIPGVYSAPPSPVFIKIGCDIPIYEGYDYAPSTPKRYDSAPDYMAPPRCPPLILVKIASDKYANGGEDLGMGMQIDDFGFYVQYGPDSAVGTRYFSGTSGGVGGAASKNDLVVTVGLTFGNRVRMATSNGNLDETKSGRRLYLYVPGAHLWLAHPGAIWEHSKFTATDKNAPGKRNAAGGAGAVPGIIRDDRDSLAIVHALAWSWYGTKRTSAQWALNDCGLLPDFATVGASDGPTRTPYPKLGYVVKEIYAAGHTSQTPLVIRTPINRIVYQHESGRTTWYTDWQDLDTSKI